MTQNYLDVWKERLKGLRFDLAAQAGVCVLAVVSALVAAVWGFAAFVVFVSLLPVAFLIWALFLVPFHKREAAANEKEFASCSLSNLTPHPEELSPSGESVTKDVPRGLTP